VTDGGQLSCKTGSVADVIIGDSTFILFNGFLHFPEFIVQASSYGPEIQLAAGHLIEVRSESVSDIGAVAAERIVCKGLQVFSRRSPVVRFTLYMKPRFLIGKPPLVPLAQPCIRFPFRLKFHALVSG